MAMDQQQLLDDEAKAWTDFLEAVTAVAPDQRSMIGVVPGWSAHDIVWHCAYWAEYATGRLERQRRGEAVPEEEPSLSDDEILAQGRAMSWDEALGKLTHIRDRARAALSMPGDVSDEAIAEFVSETADHYADHAGQLHDFAS